MRWPPFMARASMARPSASAVSASSTSLACFELAVVREKSSQLLASNQPTATTRSGGWWPLCQVAAGGRCVHNVHVSSCAVYAVGQGRACGSTYTAMCSCQEGWGSGVLGLGHSWLLLQRREPPVFQYAMFMHSLCALVWCKLNLWITL